MLYAAGIGVELPVSHEVCVLLRMVCSGSVDLAALEWNVGNALMSPVDDWLGAGMKLFVWKFRWMNAFVCW